MKYEPKRHQRIGEEWLKSHDRTALLWEMGLGR